MGVSTTLDGVESVATAFDLFGRVGTRKVLRQSLRNVAKKTAAKAASKIRHRSGQMGKRIKVRAGKRDENAVSMVVMTDGAEASHLELGHRMGNRQLGNRREVVEPFPFLRPGFDETVEAAVQTVIDDLNNQIADTLAKGNA